MKKKHIYIYSPSSAVRDKAAFRRGIKRLQALGHEVEIDEAALRALGPIPSGASGPDAVQAARLAQEAMGYFGP